ncbi:orotidine-5'-phosphate decarboxylase [Alphaproteobacteria bacterium]|nr:orotidine-5'-phosphate decarboxylase [Alphaproteobacteria bacterium]
MINHFGDRLVAKIRNSKSFLCLGVDPHLDLIPKIFDENTKSSNIVRKVEKFCYSLLDAAIGFVPAIKPQIALFEQLGPDGMKLLSSLCKHAQSQDFLVIMDAKRGDIGSTSQAYANAYLGKNAPFPSDALTVNPWLGIDSLEPFFKKASTTGSGLFILTHTSNKGSKDIQEMPLSTGIKCYEHLANILKPIVENYIGTSGLSSIGVVSGATFKEESLALRKLLPNAPFLIPGYGTQGASAKDACAPLIQDSKHSNLLNFGLINASRSILFPEESYLASNIEEWRKSVLSKINSINNELININNSERHFHE